MKSVTMILGSAVLALAALSARAATTISTGFEGPSFAPGNLNGQSGWGVNTNLCSISTANPHSGTQHMRLSTGGLLPTVFSPLASQPSMSYSTTLWFSTSNTANNFYILAYEYPNVLAWSVMLSGGFMGVGQDGGWVLGNRIQPSANTYHELRVDYNPQDNSRDYYVDGALLLHQTSIYPGISVDNINFRLMTPNADVDFDDIQIGAPVGCPDSGTLRGDANCDGRVNNFDIDAFVTGVLSNDSRLAPSGYLAMGGTQDCWDRRLCWGDGNHDAAFNNFDIDSFVACVLSAPAAGTECP